MFTAPKTRSSHAWIGLSGRAVSALRRQAERQRLQRVAAYQEQDLVFTRRGGQPLRPEYVQRRLQTLTAEAGLPRIRVHDLRHFAATTMLSSQVPLAMASKAMRHSTLSTTTEVYGQSCYRIEPVAGVRLGLRRRAPVSFIDDAAVQRYDLQEVTRSVDPAPPSHGSYYCKRCKHDHRLDNSDIGPRHYRYRSADPVSVQTTRRTTITFRQPAPANLFVPTQREAPPSQPSRPRSEEPAPLPRQRIGFLAKRRLRKDRDRAKSAVKWASTRVSGPAVQYAFDEDGFYEDVADKLIEYASAGGRHDRCDHSLCVLLNDAATAVDGSTYADLAGEGVEKGLEQMGVDKTVAAAFSSVAKVAIKKAFDASSIGNLPKAFRATIPLVCPDIGACPARTEVFQTYGTPFLSDELKDIAERLGATRRGE